jgi:hypothetical protein
MSVQEMIDELMKEEDKTQPVVVCGLGWEAKIECVTSVLSFDDPKFIIKVDYV